MVKNVKLRIMPTILVIIFSFSAFIIPASAKSKQVIIGGEAFGLKLYCKGVMITHFESFLSNGENVCPAKESGLKMNDIILNADKKNVKSNEQIDSIVKNSKGKEINFTVLRNSKELNIKVKPKLNSNKEYYIGLWVRDSCAGLGTISYYDTQNKTYGALGHGICDIDTGGLMPSGKGEILKADITSVTKSKNNQIGTLNGYFTEETIGNIKTNSIIGIYGNITEKVNKNKKYEVCDNSEIKPGKAKLITTVSGTEPKEYDIEITYICTHSENTNRNFVLKITDECLLKKTGGIVQGMSGSPIIQNGKFAGALTHVFLEDCKRGYGIFAENMIQN